jgi:hypothetical protein
VVGEIQGYQQHWKVEETEGGDLPPPVALPVEGTARLEKIKTM